MRALSRRGKTEHRKRLLTVAGLALVALAAAGYGAHWWTTGRFFQSTDDAYVGGEVTVIGTKVPGYITQVAVVDNQAVHAGDLLVKIDDRDYRAALAKAEGAVAAQQATLANLDATAKLQQAVIAQARASVNATSADTVRAHEDQVHATSIVEQGGGIDPEFAKSRAPNINRPWLTATRPRLLSPPPSANLRRDRQRKSSRRKRRSSKPSPSAISPS